MSSQQTPAPPVDPILESFTEHQSEERKPRMDSHGVKPHCIRNHSPKQRLHKLAAAFGDYFKHPTLDLDEVTPELADDASYAWVQGIHNTQFGREWARILESLTALSRDGATEHMYFDLFYAEEDYDPADTSALAGGFGGRANQFVAAGVTTSELQVKVCYYVDGRVTLKGGYAVTPGSGCYQQVLDMEFEPVDKRKARETRETLRDLGRRAAQARSQHIWTQKQAQCERARNAREARRAQTTAADETGGERDDREFEPLDIDEEEIVWADEHRHTLSDERAAEITAALEAHSPEDDDQEVEEVVKERPRERSAASETPLHDML